MIRAHADGVGLLEAYTIVNERTLRAFFPDHDVELVRVPKYEDMIDEFWAVRAGDRLQLRVRFCEQSLISVDILDPDIPTPLGVRIGQTHAEVEKSLGPLYCRDASAEVDWRENIVVGTSSKTGDYALDFADLEHHQVAATLLREPERLAASRLVAITWESPLTKPPGANS